MSDLYDSDPRLQNLRLWLSTISAPATLASTLRPASSDASFRRYFRVDGVDGATYIVMDAPPPQEDVRPFIKIADLFGKTGVAVPAILAKDEEQGFLLLSDLGSTTYLSLLKPETASPLYLDAIDALIQLQSHSQPNVLPAYDRALLHRELMLFPDWYINKHLGVTLSEKQTADLNKVFEVLLANNLAQAPVYVHRDYHSRNLMVCTPLPGVIDFQDAVYGPITYDLVSLLRDAYIQWPEARVLDWCIRFWEQARAAGLPVPTDFACFHQDFEWMGLQRHLKVLGIFARLAHRDGKTRYLDDIPMVLSYARTVAKRYRDLHPLVAVLDRAAGQPTPRVGLSF
jgi:aminoglycoside/choline kinase family phosphotransferase